MNLTSAAKSVLFLSSYAPLMLVIAILEMLENWIASIAFAVAAVLSLIILALFLRQARNIQPRNVTLKSAHNRTGESMAYFMTYLLAFMRFDLGTWQGIVAFLVVVAILGMIYVKSDLIFVNPSLVCAGYRVIGAQRENGDHIAVITRRRDLGVTGKTHLRFVSDDLGIEVENGRNG